jgi:acyl-CoA synthetase (AMP-forming)/AMP-acid ligase II
MLVLSRANRSQFATILDAITLTQADSHRPTIIYIQTGQKPIIITRAQFRDHINNYAAALSHKGLRPHDLIIIAHTQNLESIFAFWGALRLGAIPSMFPTLTEKLDPHIYIQSMTQLVALSGVRAIFTTDQFAPELAQVVDCPVFGPAELLAASIVPPVQYTPASDEIALLQHSSGTTGLQKGVALSHHAILNQLASYSDSLMLNHDDVIVSWLPLYHDMGLIAGFLLPLMQGIPLVLMSPFDWVSHPAMLFKAIDQYRGTLCWLPNFAYNHCARRIRSADIEGLSLASVRALINCSEPVRHDSHALFVERFAHLGMTPEKLAVSYAMAENVFAVTQTPVGQPAALDAIDRDRLTTEQRAVPIAPDLPNAVVQVSCGPPISGVEVRVLDQADQILPDRIVGEFAIKSDSLLTGYYHRDDLHPFTSDGWYKTGDMGYLADGEVYVIGRYKDLIINAGKNVYPQDIEVIVNTISGIIPGRAVVFGVPDVREGTELIAVVAEVDTNDANSRREIIKQIRQKISQQSMVTVSYVHLVQPRWLIKTSSGKIARAANRDKWLREQANQS